MSALGRIELEVVDEPYAEGRRRFIGPPGDLLILHTAPQLFDNDIVDLPPFAVHTDVAVMREKYLRKSLTDILCTLVSVKDLWCPIAHESFFQRCNTQICLERIGNSPRQQAARISV